MKFLDVLAVWYSKFIRNFYIESDNIKILPSGAFPDSNQRLTVGLKPPGKASRPKTLLNRSCQAAFALPACNTFGIFDA